MQAYESSNDRRMHPIDKLQYSIFQISRALVEKTRHSLSDLKFGGKQKGIVHGAFDSTLERLGTLGGFSRFCFQLEKHA